MNAFTRQVLHLLPIFGPNFLLHEFTSKRSCHRRNIILSALQIHFGFKFSFSEWPELLKIKFIINLWSILLLSRDLIGLVHQSKI